MRISQGGLAPFQNFPVFPCSQIFPYMFAVNISANQFPLSLKSTTCCSGVSWGRYKFFFSPRHFFFVHLIPKPLGDPKSSFFNGATRVRNPAQHSIVLMIFTIIEWKTENLDSSLRLADVDITGVHVAE